MPQKPVTYLSLLLFFITACSQLQTSEELPPTFSLQAAETKSWKATTYPQGGALYVDYYTDNNKAYLVWENRIHKSVEFYDWQGDSLSFAVKPALKALQQKCHMRGFYIASTDSVYILNPMRYEMYLLNRQGDLLKTLEWNKEQVFGKQGHSMSGIYAGSPGIRQGDWLQMFSVPETGSTRRITFTEGKTNLALNLKTGEHRYGYHYSPTYRNGEYGHYYIDIARCLTPDGQFLYSFGPDDSVRLTDYKNPDKTFYAGSDYFDTPPEIPQFLRDKKTPPVYRGILYDASQEVYYRMAFHGLPDRDMPDFQTTEEQLSIIILNKHFEKIGESLLPAGKHSQFQWFIGPDGLYIAHQQSGSYPQDGEMRPGPELSFTRYELVADQ